MSNESQREADAVMGIMATLGQLSWRQRRRVLQAALNLVPTELDADTWTALSFGEQSTLQVANRLKINVTAAANRLVRLRRLGLAKSRKAGRHHIWSQTETTTDG